MARTTLNRWIWWVLFLASTLPLNGQGHPPAAALEPNHSVERELSGGQEHTYHIALDAGECANVMVAQRGIDVTVTIVDPKGHGLAEFDSESRTVGQEPVVFTADLTGNYMLIVKPKYPRAAKARYEIRFTERRPATERDRFAFGARVLAYDSLRFEYDGKVDQALQAEERALALEAQAVGPDDSYSGVLLYGLGHLKQLKGDYASAEQLYQRAIAVDEKALGREDPQTAMALRGLGEFYTVSNQFAKADPLLHEQLAIVERTLGAEHPKVALGLRLTASLYRRREDLEHAQADLTRAIAVAEKTYGPEDLPLIAMVHDLGALYDEMGDSARAEPVLERALQMLEGKFGPDSLYVASPLLNLATIALKNQQYGRALDFFSRSEKIRETIQGRQHPDAATAEMGTASVYAAQGDYARAAAIHQNVLQTFLATVGPYHDLTLTALSNMAEIYAAQGDISRAIEYQARHEDSLEKDIALNLAIGSERQKLAYLNSTSESTDRMIWLHVREAPANPAAREAAATILLQRKGRVLDAMSGSMASLRQRLGVEEAKLLDDLGSTNARLAGLALGGAGKLAPGEFRKQLATLEDQREKLEAAISNRSAEFRAQSHPVTVAAVQSAIPPGAALIEFGTYRPFDPKQQDPSRSYGNTRYVAYVFRQQAEVGWVDLGDTAPIDQAVAALRQALRDRTNGDVQKVARTVDEKVMRPVRALTGGVRHLLISPDGMLNLIPFEALVDPQGRYLLESYSIDYLTTGRDLLRMQVAVESKHAPVVLADPDFGEPASPQFTRGAATRRSITSGKDLSEVYFAPLAGTAEEARSIRSLFPRAEILAGARATKARLKLVDAPVILHIATHGFFLDEASQDGGSGTRGIRANLKVENPLLRSGLALAGANLQTRNADNGILTALEASSLNLWGTKVVVLSACETGVGEVKKGEGVYGLRRAFFLAGAETLVMSLWPVSDRVTRELMTAYYTGLKQGLGRGEALREAQLSLLQRKDRGHPYYWASFIQSGDWRNLDGK